MLINFLLNMDVFCFTLRVILCPEVYAFIVKESLSSVKCLSSGSTGYVRDAYTIGRKLIPVPDKE